MQHYSKNETNQISINAMKIPFWSNSLTHWSLSKLPLTLYTLSYVEELMICIQISYPSMIVIWRRLLKSVHMEDVSGQQFAHLTKLSSNLIRTWDFTNGLWVCNLKSSKTYNYSHLYFDDAIRPHFCTCHDSWAVMACTRLWPNCDVTLLQNRGLIGNVYSQKSYHSSAVGVSNGVSLMNSKSDLCSNVVINMIQILYWMQNRFKDKVAVLYWPSSFKHTWLSTWQSKQRSHSHEKQMKIIYLISFNFSSSYLCLKTLKSFIRIIWTLSFERA